MVFYFGLLLPLVFALTSLTIAKKEQLYVSVVSSFSILLLFYVGLLLNRTVGILSFLDYEHVGHFGAIASPTSISIIVVFLLSAILCTVFFKNGIIRNLSPWGAAASFVSIFFVTTLVSSENIMFFLFACESLIWLNVFQLKCSDEKKKSLYFLTAISTGILLILTIFLGLLESIFLSEMTYNLANLGKISLSYVSGTIYSTQTLFFMLAVTYVVLRISFLLQILSLIILSEKTRNISIFIATLGVPAILISFYVQQVELYGLAMEEYCGLAMIISLSALVIIYALNFKNQIFSWSSKWIG